VQDMEIGGESAGAAGIHSLAHCEEPATAPGLARSTEESRPARTTRRCLQNTRKLSATVAHLGIRRRRVGRNRLVSDSVVVSLGGHRPFLLDKLLADSSMALLLCSQ
jgi:hypothetical protein